MDARWQGRSNRLGKVEGGGGAVGATVPVPAADATVLVAAANAAILVAAAAADGRDASVVLGEWGRGGPAAPPLLTTRREEVMDDGVHHVI